MHFCKTPLSGIFILLLSSMTLQAETLQYQAHYKGVFSLFERLSIADVVLQTKPVSPAANNNLQKISLSVSSEAHPTVESLYPFRYTFDSYYSDVSGQTLAFEHLKSSSKKGKKHYVGFVEGDNGDAQLFRAKAHKPLVSGDLLADFLRHGLRSQQIQALDLSTKSPALKQLKGILVDRLTLLSRIRHQVKAGIEQTDYRVTNGDKLMKYRVTLKSREQLDLGADGTTSAQKIKIEAWQERKQADFDHEDILQVNASTTRDYLHAPVYAWFSVDDRAIPLKFVNKHAVGEFVITIKNDDLLQQASSNY